MFEKVAIWELLKLKCYQAHKIAKFGMHPIRQLKLSDVNEKEGF